MTKIESRPEAVLPVGISSLPARSMVTMRILSGHGTSLTHIPSMRLPAQAYILEGSSRRLLVGLYPMVYQNVWAAHLKVAQANGRKMGPLVIHLQRYMK